MTKDRQSFLVLLVLQVLAVSLYPPSFFQAAPQALVLPPALILLLLIGLGMMNFGILSLLVGRSFLVFVQGVNIVVRLMMLMPNLKHANGSWDPLLLILGFLGMGLSWYTITQMEKRPPATLLLRTLSN